MTVYVETSHYPALGFLPAPPPFPTSAVAVLLIPVWSQDIFEVPGGQEDVDVHFNAGDDAAEGRELPNKSHFFVQALAAGPRPCRRGRETDLELSRAVLPMPQASALLPERLRRGPWPWTGTRVSSCVFCLIPGGCEIVFAHRSHAASEAP